VKKFGPGNQKRPSPNLSLNVSGKIFSVKKSQLVEMTGLFQTATSLLNAEDYEVRTQVPESVFAEFVRMIEGGKITVSEETWKPLKLLSEEFDCEILANECTAFAKSHSLDSQTTIESLIDSLSKRICDLAVSAFQASQRKTNAAAEIAKSMP
jgi:hypothetical protein